MSTVLDVYNAIDDIAPFELAQKSDNVGILLGDKKAVIKKVLLTLDVTVDTVKEACDTSCQLILTHHPIIYAPIKGIYADSPLYHAAQAALNVISAHTNIDIAEGGLNDMLADLLGLRNTSPLEIGRIGKMPKAYTSLDLAMYVKDRFRCRGVRFVSCDKSIKKVAICSGGGGEFLEEAVEKGADAFVTADIKYHHMLYAKEKNIALIDAGHFNTEIILMPILKSLLENIFGDVEFILSKSCVDPIEYI